MSDTFLTTYSILVTELAVILIIATGFLTYRLLKAKKAPAPEAKQAKPIKQLDLDHFLKELTIRTEARLQSLDSDKDAAQHVATQSRLDVLKSEARISSSSSDEDAYWASVDSEYAEEEDIELKKLQQDRKSAILSIGDMNKLLQDSEEILVESYNTLSSFRDLINEDPAPDADALLKRVDDVDSDQRLLQEKLKLTSKKIEATLGKLNKSSG